MTDVTALAASIDCGTEKWNPYFRVAPVQVAVGRMGLPDPGAAVAAEAALSYKWPINEQLTEKKEGHIFANTYATTPGKETYPHERAYCIGL